jgi:E3 ubiquitin-protein ligase DOA10
MAESPIMSQVGKLGKSVVLYGALMTASSIAAVATRFCFPHLLPLRWDFTGAVSTIPVDLLVAYLLVPMSLRACKPVRTSKRLFKSWVVITAHQLRLSSFLLGKRRPTEEGHYARRDSWKNLLFRMTPACSAAVHRPNAVDCGCERVWVPSGTMALAPALDHIKLVHGRPATIPLDANGEPRSEEDKRVMDAYLAEGYTASNWEAIYLPPWFRTRLMLALYLLWISGSAFAISLLVGPREL